MFTIYALADPQTKRIRYVGKTSRNPERRLYFHIYNASHGSRKHCHEWIDSLLKEGLKPEIVVCDTCDSEDVADDLEVAWIKLFRMAGVPLTNHTDGGEDGGGMRGHKHTEETREKIRASHLGLRPTDEARRKMSIAQRRRETSDETKAKLHTSNLGKGRGRTVSDETKEKNRIAHIGKRASKEAKARMSASQTGRTHSEETREKMRQTWAKKRARRTEITCDRSQAHE